ncbi:signal transduction histidine kinase [Novosphingobium chloroacetimidivorans]|uniref:histidine kinase n=1 Tax=Novosphingobium chloroacetimidivorans TaxID=1428314 RepID=A0A7W7KC00_9SPHN|nr:ATP-binding protein [Novosphingobium chloroacetimidivorans]MBB4859278.1 signal transduction histidine kinase [Novosphingobium chloroacetimidivorans]
MIEHANARALELFGVFDPSDLSEESLSQIVSGEDFHALWALLAAAATGARPQLINISARTLSGDHVPVRVGARLVAPGSIRLVFAAIEAFDQTASRLRASERRYRQLFHAMPIALLRIDSRGSLAMFEEPRRQGFEDLDAYLRANPAAFERALDTICVAEANEHAETMFGDGTPRSMLRSVRVFWQARPDTFRRILRARYAGHRNVIEETVVCGVAGQRVPVLFSMAFPTDDARVGNSLIGMIDMSGQMRAEAELRRTQARFANAARTSVTNELAASIAHEVSQPLSSIATNGGTALRWLSKSPPDLTRAVSRLQRILDDAERANGVISRMRDMSSGVMVERSNVDLNAVVREALLILNDEIHSKAVEVRLHLDEGLPTLSGDHVQLTQVMVNLVINAMQAMEKSGSVRPTIDIITRLLDDGWLALEVKDSGPGIGAAHLTRIFDSFFTTKSAGLGIGLAVSRSIVEAHDGSLLASNGGLGGAVFTVRLPTIVLAAEKIAALPGDVGQVFLAQTRG